MRVFFNVSLKLFFCLSLSACLLTVLGCSKEKTNRENVLIVGMENTPTNLDPRFALDLASSQVIQLIFNSLISYDTNGNLIPDLAERWEIFDNREYIFYLKKGVRFHDGKELTSSDVKFTFDSILAPGSQSPIRRLKTT